MQLSFFAQIDNTPLDSNILYSSHHDMSEFLSRAKESKVLAVDTETYGYPNQADGLRHWSGSVRLIQIGLPTGEVGVFDLGGVLSESTTKSLWLDSVKEVLESGNIIKVLHNAKFDALFLRSQLDVKIKNIRDTMLLSQLLYSGLSHGHSLKACLQRELGIELDKTAQKSNFGGELSNSQINYSARDVANLIELFKVLGRKLIEAGIKENSIIEMDAILPFVDMEFHGFCIDKELTELTLKDYESTVATILKPFLATFPHLSPTASHNTIVNALNTLDGVNLFDSTDAELSTFADRPEIKALMLFRTLKKYIDYLKGMLANTRKTKYGYRVFGNYKQLGRKGFGRSTCGSDSEQAYSNAVKAIDGINLQNCPKKLSDPELKQFNLRSIRECFTPQKGRTLLISDLSQAHARIAAEASQDHLMIKSYNEKLDIHCLTGVALAKMRGINTDYDNFVAGYKAKNQDLVHCRNIAKNVNYGSINCQGKNALLKSAAKGGIPMTESDAIDGLEAWKSNYSGMVRYQRQLTRDADTKTLKGYAIITGYSGRRLHLPLVPDFNGRLSVKPQEACAFVWCSTEADVVKFAASEFTKACEQHPEWEAFLVNCCHDELDAECNEKYKLECATALFDAMKRGMERYIKTIPVIDESDTPEKCIVNSYGDK